MGRREELRVGLARILFVLGACLKPLMSPPPPHTHTRPPTHPPTHTPSRNVGAMSVFTTRSLLGALGVGGKHKAEAAAAINWVVKDGAGRLGRFMFARM